MSSSSPSICVQGSIPLDLLTEGHCSNHFFLSLLPFPAAYKCAISLYNFFMTLSPLPVTTVFLLSFEGRHLLIILFIFTASHFSRLTFCLKLTLARLPSHHSIKMALISVTRDLYAAESHVQFSVLILTDLSAAGDAFGHKSPPGPPLFGFPPISLAAAF